MGDEYEDPARVWLEAHGLANRTWVEEQLPSLNMLLVGVAKAEREKLSKYTTTLESRVAYTESLETSLAHRCDELASMDARMKLALDRLTAMSEVPCVDSAESKRYPMRCFRKDACSFCRARETLAEIGRMP